jgi:hypothetical protein
MSNAKRDDNRVPLLLAASNADSSTPVQIEADPTTKRLLTNATISGTVTVSGGGASQADNSTFTPGTTTFAPIGAEVDDTGTTAVTENNAGSLRMSTRRELYTQIRDAAGNERGLNVDANGEVGINLSHVAGQGAISSGVNGSQAVGGDTASAATDAGNPVKVGGKFNSTLPTFTNGQRGDLQIISKGSLLTAPTDVNGTLLFTLTTPGDGTSNAVNLARAWSWTSLFNGSTWDRVRSVITGTNSTGTGIAAVGNLAQFDDSSPTSITEDQFGNLRMSANRNLYGTIRDAAGNERGANVNSSNQLSVSVDNSNVSTNIAQMNGVAVTMGNGASGTGVQRVTIANDSTGVVGLSTGTNSIGKITDITASVVPGTAATNLGKAEDAAHSSGDTGVMMLGVRESAPTDLSAGATNGDYEPLQVAKEGGLWVSHAATGGSSGLSVATGSIAATKTDIGSANTAGSVYGWYFYNPNASVAYVQFFNTQASGVTLGTTAPVYSLGIPATSGANVVNPLGIPHSTAICIAITTTRAGSTGPGSTVDYNIFYKQ